MRKAMSFAPQAVPRPKMDRRVWGPLMIVGAYVVAGRLGLMLASVHPGASTAAVYGLALAAALVLGYRVWPALFVGAFLVSMTTKGAVWTSLGIASASTIEGLLGAFLVRRFANGRRVFDRARDIFRFTALAGLASTAVGATVGAASLCLGGHASWQRFEAIWLTWWLGDVASVLVVAPVLILWGLDRRLRLAPARALELVLLLGSTVLVGGLTFGGLLPWAPDYPITFLCIPPLVVATFRFGQREALTCAALLSAGAVWGTLRGSGPFARFTQNESLLLLEVLMATMAITTLLLGAIVKELARVSAIVESSDDAIIGKTLDGIITDWNEGARALYGYSAAEVIGRPISILVPPERHDELPKILDRLARGERISHYDTVRVTRDGRRVEVSLTVSPTVDSAGRIMGASSIARDISERKQAEAAARERDSLRYVASLAAAAAHEINNPLAVVMGNSHLLADEVHDLRARGKIAQILDAIGRIKDIVVRMKDIDRIELTDEARDVPEMLDLRKSSKLN